MGDFDEALIWKFLDGDLTRSEADQIEERLELEENFRRKMADIRDLDNLLAARTAELPSMRFTTNVMERVARPINLAVNYFVLPKKFAKWYLATIAGLLLATMGVGFGGSTGGALSEGSQQIAKTVSTLISNSSVLIFFQISIGMAGLLILDYFLRRKYKLT